MYSFYAERSGIECVTYEKSADFEIDTLDLLDPNWQEYDFSGYDSIFHVAAIVHKREKKISYEEYKKVNTDLPVLIAKKAKKAADKKLLKGLENDVVLKVIDFFIDKRNDLEDRIVNLFKEIEPVIELRAEVFGNEKREQDSHTFTLDDGTASVKVGWNVRPSFNGTEAEGIVKLQQYMASLAGETENEKILMDMIIH